MVAIKDIHSDLIQEISQQSIGYGLVIQNVSLNLSFKLEVGDSMLKRLNDSDGFILLESLLALSIITFAVMIILPFSRSLLTSRHDRVVQVEGYRLLYDYTNQGLPAQTSHVNRSGQKHMITKNNNSGRVSTPSQRVVDVRMKSCSLEKP